jgi:hypothetical protein
VTASKLLIASLLALAAAAGFAQSQSGETVFRWVDKDGRVHYSDQNPPKDAREVKEKRVTGTNVIDTSGPGYALRKAQQDHPVSLYTAVTCEAECKQARDFLGARGVPYSEISLKSAEEAGGYKRLFGDEVFVPSITVGSQKHKGFEGGAWAKLLEDAGYPRAAAPATAQPRQSSSQPQ